MPPPSFIFVRHGEATHNVAFRATTPGDEAVFKDPKHEDAPLTEKGLKQARDTALSLADYRIIDIWSSPLTRCLQTTGEIFEETSAGSVYLHDGLLERLGGDHICNTRKPTYRIKGENPCYNTDMLPELGPCWFKRENQTSLSHRMRSLMLLIGELYKDVPEESYVVIVSHADAIFALLGESLKNAEFTIKSLDDILTSTILKDGPLSPASPW